MKRLIFIFFIAIFPLFTVACDQAVPEKKNKTVLEEESISSMLASGKGRKIERCTVGDVSLNCEFLTGDQTGAGKWRHVKIFIHKNGNVSMTMDGQSYYQHNVEKHSANGTDIFTYLMKGVESGTAEIDLSSSNAGKALSFEAFNADGKREALGRIEVN